MQDANIQLQIGANADQLKQVILDVEKRLESLKNKIASLPDGAKGFNKLVREFNSLSKSAQNLDANLSNIGGKTQGTSKRLSPLTNSTKDARNALTSLSLVAQDLPFGFIGIQNNLPRVIESFGDLSNSVKTSAISFKQLAPAIGFLGFSVVTAGITALIQKYGDLGTAVDAIFGKKISDSLRRAKEDFAEFTKELLTTKEISTQAASSQDGIIIKLQTLSGVVLDLTESEQRRKNALDQLKALDKDRFANFDIEKGKLEGLKGAVEEYTNALITQAVAKKFEDQVAEASIKLNQQRDAFEENLKVIDDLKREYPNIEQEVADYNKRLAESARLAEKGIKTGYIGATEEVRKFNKALNEVSTAEKNQKEAFNIYTELKTKFEDATKASTEFVQSVDKVSGKEVKIKFDFEVPKLEEFLKFEKYYELENALNRLDQFGDVLLDVNAKEKDRVSVLQKLQSEESKVLGINSKFFENLSLGKTSYEDLKKAVIDYGFAIQEAILAQDKLFKPLFENKFQLSDYVLKGLKGINPDDIETDEIKKKFDQLKELTRNLPKGLRNDVMPSFEEFKQLILELGQLEAFKTTEGTLGLDKVNQIVDEQLGILENKLKNLKLFADSFTLLNQTFFEPLQNAFVSLFEKGTFGFKTFADTVLKQIKQLVAKIIATGIISLIANLATGGFSSAAGGFAAGIARVGKDIGAALGLGGRKEVNPNFGGLQSGFGLTGQVVFRQSGSDLVGVLNRTNATINRVG